LLPARIKIGTTDFKFRNLTFNDVLAILEEAAAMRNISRIRKGGLFIVLGSLCRSVHGVLIEDHDVLLLIWSTSQPAEHGKDFSGDRDVPY
jgi:hypothetical protein